MRGITMVAACALAIAMASCGSDDSDDGAAEAVQAAPSVATTTSTEFNDAAASARAAAARVDRRHKRSVIRYFKTQEMTPPELYEQGISAPQSLWKVHSIRSIDVADGRVTIKTDLYPKSENADLFRGACSQVASTFSWTSWISVVGPDDLTHASGRPGQVPPCRTAGV